MRFFCSKFERWNIGTRDVGFTGRKLCVQDVVQCKYASDSVVMRVFVWPWVFPFVALALVLGLMNQ